MYKFIIYLFACVSYVMSSISVRVFIIRISNRFLSIDNLLRVPNYHNVFITLPVVHGTSPIAVLNLFCYLYTAMLDESSTSCLPLGFYHNFTTKYNTRVMFTTGYCEKFATRHTTTKTTHSSSFFNPSTLYPAQNYKTTIGPPGKAQ